MFAIEMKESRPSHTSSYAMPIPEILYSEKYNKNPTPEPWTIEIRQV